IPVRLNGTAEVPGVQGAYGGFEECVVRSRRHRRGLRGGAGVGVRVDRETCQPKALLGDLHQLVQGLLDLLLGRRALEERQGLPRVRRGRDRPGARHPGGRRAWPLLRAPAAPSPWPPGPLSPRRGRRLRSWTCSVAACVYPPPCARVCEKRRESRSFSAVLT